jgi:hypothetical protein
LPDENSSNFAVKEYLPVVVVIGSVINWAENSIDELK